MLTVSTFNNIAQKDISNIKIVIFDIDGTVSNPEIIYGIIKNTFTYFNLKLKRMPQLGKEKFNTEWIRNELKLEISFAEEIINYYENIFYSTNQNKFIQNVFCDVVPFFEKLKKQNILIGFFTLRHMDLALIQIRKMGLLDYVYVNPNIEENNGLQISGSNMNKQILSPLEEKVSQLRFHHNSLFNIDKTNFLIIGDSIETDIYAAKQMEFNHCLIKR